MFEPHLTSALALAMALATACAADVGPATGVAPPDLGKADGSDAADRSCRVVLREALRPRRAAGPESACDSGTCWAVIEATVDVARSSAASVASVGVLFRSTWQEGWFEAAARPAPGAEPGFDRYVARIAERTFETGASASTLERTRLELVPLVHTISGTRLFDHNRRSGDFDVYTLDGASAFSVPDDAASCRAEPSTRATLTFARDFTETQRGAITAGGEVTIAYDLERLPACRGTHNGHPAWDLRAFVRFEPGGGALDESVRELESVLGTPTTSARARPMTFRVPSGTRQLVVYFVNHTGAGSSCRTWDSDFGADYRFDVLDSAPPAVGWAGVSGGSFTRACEHRDDGVADPARVDGYVMERACMFVDADVWTPGLTDGDAPASYVFAEVEWRLDAGPAQVEELPFVGRVGNDYRYRWTLPRSELARAPWDRLTYAFRFSTDGRTSYRVARGAGPDGGEARVVERDPGYCPSSWPAGACAP